MIAATATEIKNNFDKYLDDVIAGNEVVVTVNGKEIGRFVPRAAAVSYLSDSLVGVLKGNVDLDEARQEGLSAKYESVD
jgi:prevent-host-death family protein